MGKPSAPTPPDPAKTAQAQTTSNIETAIANGYLNATNQNTPYGTVRYNQTGGQQVGSNFVPTFESTVSLNPQYQSILDSQARVGQQALDTGQTALGNAQNTLNSPFSLSGAPGLVTNVGAGGIQRGYNTVGPMFGIAPGGQIQGQIDRSNLSAVPLTADDFAKQGQATTDALMSRFNQDWDRQNSANDAKLANQGIALGSEAYGADKDVLNRARNDAMAQALLAGNQEQNTLFNQALASRGQMFGENQAAGNFANAAQAQQFGQNAAQQAAYNQAAAQQTGYNADLANFFNTAQGQQYQQGMGNATLQNQGRQQYITEQELLRSQPLNELATLLGFSPGIQTPNAPSFGGNVAGTDVAGITQNNFANQMANYQLRQQQQNAAMGGLFGLGSAAIFASDIRLKKDIHRIGTTAKGLPIYLYTKDGKREVGVMAQDVEKVMPWAVVEMDNGFKAVNYDMVA